MACLDRTNVFELLDKQNGNGLPYFSGTSPYQMHMMRRGHGISTLFKKYVAPIVKKMGKDLAKEGIEIAKNVASDMITAKNPKEAVKKAKKSLKENLKSRKGNIQSTALNSFMDAVKKTQKGRGGNINKNNRKKKKNSTKKCPKNQSVANIFKNYFNSK